MRFDQPKKKRLGGKNPEENRDYRETTFTDERNLARSHLPMLQRLWSRVAVETSVALYAYHPGPVSQAEGSCGDRDFQVRCHRYASRLVAAGGCAISGDTDRSALAYATCSSSYNWVLCAHIRGPNRQRAFFLSVSTEGFACSRSL